MREQDIRALERRSRFQVNGFLNEVLEHLLLLIFFCINEVDIHCVLLSPNLTKTKLLDGHTWGMSLSYTKLKKKNWCQGIHKIKSQSICQSKIVYIYISKSKSNNMRHKSDGYRLKFHLIFVYSNSQCNQMMLDF